MTEKERMLEGKLYISMDEELINDMKKSRRITRLYNTTTEEEQDYRKELLKELFESTKENYYRR